MPRKPGTPSGRLLYTFEAAVRSLLLGPGNLALKIGLSYRAFNDGRRGRRPLSIKTTRALVAYLRRRAFRLSEVADALERASDVAEAE
jgi:hypothetical protein